MHNGGSTRLTPVALPFYKPTHVLLNFQTLPRSPVHEKKLRTEFNFVVSNSTMADVGRRKHFEIQARFFEYDPTKLHNVPDSNPPNYKIWIDGKEIYLNRPLPFDPKRCLSFPVDLSSDISRSFTSHLIRIEWTETSATYVMAVFLVERIGYKQIFDQIRSDRNRYQDESLSDNKLNKQLNAQSDEDGDIGVDMIKLSLQCPITRKRMTVPVKGSSCHHFQCFDLETYLQLAERRPTWKCPVCRILVYPESVVIDGFFLKLLKNTERIRPVVTDLVFNKDGNYRLVRETETNDDEEKVPSQNPRKAISSEFIDIESSDEEVADQNITEGVNNERADEALAIDVAVADPVNEEAEPVVESVPSNPVHNEEVEPTVGARNEVKDQADDEIELVELSSDEEEASTADITVNSVENTTHSELEKTFSANVSFTGLQFRDFRMHRNMTASPEADKNNGLPQPVGDNDEDVVILFNAGAPGESKSVPLADGTVIVLPSDATPDVLESSGLKAGGMKYRPLFSPAKKAKTTDDIMEDFFESSGEEE